MSERMMETPDGPARLVTRRAPSPFATLLLSHGAGAGVDTHDLLALAKHLPKNGVTVHLLEQPWKVAGRKVAGPPASLDRALNAVVDGLRTQTQLVIGGRSAGARSAARRGKPLGASGVLALAFPLHPPGRPEKSRVDELEGAGLPTLVVQGERDAFGKPDEFPAGTNMCAVPYADHSLKVPAKAPLSLADVDALLVEATLEWLVRTVGPS